MDDRGISNRRDWSAFLLVVGHQSLDATLARADCVEGVALSSLCALEHRFAPGAAVLSFFGRAELRTGCARLGLGRRQYDVRSVPLVF